MNSGKVRVLVINGDAVLRQGLTRTLGEHPAVDVVGWAINGRTALPKILALQPDLVLLDLEQNVPEGLELLGRLHETSGPQRLVIAPSSEAPATVLQAVQFGALDVVRRPVGLSGEALVARLTHELMPQVLRTQPRVCPVPAALRAVPPLSLSPTRPLLGPASSGPQTSSAPNGSSQHGSSLHSASSGSHPSSGGQSSASAPNSSSASSGAPNNSFTNSSFTNSNPPNGVSNANAATANPPHALSPPGPSVVVAIPPAPAWASPPPAAVHPFNSPPASALQAPLPFGVTPLLRPPQVLAIGVSTGGPKALAQVLPLLPADFPLPVLVVQHMPPKFTQSLAESLAKQCHLRVSEARDRDRLERGRILIAPGGQHMRVANEVGSAVVRLTDDPPECSCRPSVDYLFRSVAHVFGSRVLGVVMTGMGEDGWAGSRLIHAAGGRLLAQNEATCAVFGMPRGPIEAGLAAPIPLGNLGETIVQLVRGSGAT